MKDELKEKPVTKNIVVVVDIEKKLEFQEALKKKRDYSSMKDAIIDWINLYISDNLFSKDCIMDYISLTFHSLINSKQVDKETYEIFIKQFNDNILMFKPEDVKVALSKIKEADNFQIQKDT